MSIGLLQFVKVDEIGPGNRNRVKPSCDDDGGVAEAELLPVFVDQGVEGHAVPPAGGEVVDVHVGIPEKRRHHLSLWLIYVTVTVSGAVHVVRAAGVTRCGHQL